MKNLFKASFLFLTLGMSFTACNNDNCNECNYPPPGPGVLSVHGVYILNEGNMTSDMGSLIYIDPQGIMHENVYRSANEGKSLGNVAQDLFIRDGKIYVISQNGTIDGKQIIVMNATDYKMIAEYSLPNQIEWPSHIAVLDEQHLYVRDNKGIWCFNPETNEAHFIEDTDGAMKKPMIALKDKILAAHNGNNGLMVINKDASKAEHPSTLSQISGIAKAWDGNIWISTQSMFGIMGKSALYKVSSTDFSVLATHDIKEVNLEGVGQGGASATFYAFKDLIYYCCPGSGFKNGQKIWRHNFARNKTQALDFSKLIPKEHIVYNGFAVHPLTGELMLGNIKGFGNDYKINSLLILEDQGDKLELIKEYDNNPLQFQAGTFFPESF